jgi:hypothetical protein
LWRKSSHSAQGASCVEIGEQRPIRESKSQAPGHLALDAAIWGEFVGRVKAGLHDLP